MKERNKAIPASYVFLENNRGEILMMLRQNTGYQDGMWNVPSGHMELAESPRAAMVREGKEEVGVDFSPEDLELVHVSHRPKHDNTADRIDFFFRTRRWGGEIANTEPEKCAEIRWIAPAQLPENVTPHVRYAIEAVGRGEIFSELSEQWIKDHGVWLLD